ncbi:unnamed protein product [Phaeothamnion confervicola]
MAGYFADLFNTGSSCAFRQSPFRLALQAVFCIGCSPKSADYVDYNSTSGMAELRVCRAMAEQLDPAFYDDCGLVRSNGRGDSCATSQVIVPSYHYGEGLDGALQLLNDDGGGKPPFYRQKGRSFAVFIVCIPHVCRPLAVRP